MLFFLRRDFLRSEAVRAEAKIRESAPRGRARVEARRKDMVYGRCAEYGVWAVGTGIENEKKETPEGKICRSRVFVYRY